VSFFCIQCNEICDELSARAFTCWRGTSTDMPPVNLTYNKQFGEHPHVDCDRSSAVSVLGYEDVIPPTSSYL
jgi:hypothetical protein